jgi:cyclic-di-AMP phosphodiesterase PgpH
VLAKRDALASGRTSLQDERLPREGTPQASEAMHRQSPVEPTKRRQPKSRPPVMWVVAVVSLTSAMGNRFYNQPRLDVGTEAPQTIRAPHSVSVEDTKTTEEKRKAARTGAVPVLMFDHSLTQDIYQTLEQSLDRVEELRQMSGPFPIAETTILSDATQRYLRQIKEEEWQAILARVNRTKGVQSTESRAGLGEQAEESSNIPFTQAVSELQSYRQMSSPQVFSSLIESIALARQGYAVALHQLSEWQRAESSRRYDASLLELSDRVEAHPNSRYSSGATARYFIGSSKRTLEFACSS